MRKKIGITIVVMLLLSLSACGSEPSKVKGALSQSVEYEANELMSVPNLHNGDAKFYNQLIITNLKGKLAFLDLDGNIVHIYDDISAHWVNAIEDEGIVIYGNSEHEIGIARFDRDGQLISNQIIMKTDNLQIDPAILKANDHYYAITTEVEGNVNNSDPNIENGLYTIHLYQSDNLTDWTFVCDVISKKNNLEDAEFFYQNQHFYIIYEEEEVDKGNSSICLIKSKDETDTIQWQQPKTLLSADCDHEPASVIAIEDGYCLYYSCDKENPESSYMGAKMYYALFDRDFQLQKQDMAIQSITQTGILLYDVKIQDNQYQYLFARNYLSDCDLIVENHHN